MGSMMNGGSVGERACSFASGSFRHSPDDRASVPYLHTDTLPIGASSKILGDDGCDLVPALSEKLDRPVAEVLVELEPQSGISSGRMRRDFDEALPAHLCALGDAGEDVLARELRILREYAVNVHTRGRQVQYQRYPDAVSPDTGLAEANPRVNRDPV